MNTDTPRTDAAIWRLTTFSSALLENDGEICNEINCASHDEAECLVDLLNELTERAEKAEAEVKRLTSYKPAINYPLTTRDSKGNVTYIEHSDGSEAWKEYDENNNLRHYKDSDGREYWFASEGNEIPNPNLNPTDK